MSRAPYAAQQSTTTLLVRGALACGHAAQLCKQCLVLVYTYFSLRRKAGREEVLAMPNHDQRRGLLAIVDRCSDIREIYSCLALRAQKEKLGEVEELAQEEDTQALLRLEEGDEELPGLTELYEYCLHLGLDSGFVRNVLGLILPPERYVQFEKRLTVKV